MGALVWALLDDDNAAGLARGWLGDATTTRRRARAAPAPVAAAATALPLPDAAPSAVRLREPGRAGDAYRARRRDAREPRAARRTPASREPRLTPSPSSPAPACLAACCASAQRPCARSPRWSSESVQALARGTGSPRPGGRSGAARAEVVERVGVGRLVRAVAGRGSPRRSAAAAGPRRRSRPAWMQREARSLSAAGSSLAVGRRRSCASAAGLRALRLRRRLRLAPGGRGRRAAASARSSARRRWRPARCAVVRRAPARRRDAADRRRRRPRRPPAAGERAAASGSGAAAAPAPRRRRRRRRRAAARRRRRARGARRRGRARGGARRRLRRPSAWPPSVGESTRASAGSSPSASLERRRRAPPAVGGRSAGSLASPRSRTRRPRGGRSGRLAAASAAVASTCGARLRGRRARRERPLARQQLVGDDGQRVAVAGGGRRAGPAPARARGRRRCRAPARSGSRDVSPASGAIPKSPTARRLALVEQEVGGLDVAVDDVRRRGRRRAPTAASRSQRSAVGARDRAAPAAQPVGDRAAGEVLHDDERPGRRARRCRRSSTTCGWSETRAAGARLALEARAARSSAAIGGREHLDRDEAAQELVLGRPDGGHAAAGDVADDAVARRAARRRLGQRLSGYSRRTHRQPGRAAAATLPRAMAKVCHSCGKGPAFGQSRSHSMVATKRRFNPNLQKVRVLVGSAPRRVYVCTRCLKAGKVTKAV